MAGDLHLVQTRRVLIITYHFPPAMEIGAQTCAQIGRYLPVYGWETVVLTVRERHIENLDAQNGQVFPGTIIRTGVVPHPLIIYRHLKSALRPGAQGGVIGKESFANVGVIRRWMLSLFGLPDAYTGWIPPALIKGLGVIRKQGVKSIFSSGPWWTNHLVGLTLAHLTGLPWTAHFRDPWTQVEWWKPVSALSIQVEKALERMVMEKASAVVCVTERHTALLQQAYPRLPPERFITIPNGYDGAEWDALTSRGMGVNPGRKEKFIITYAGNLYHRRNPLPLFRVLRSLIDSGDIVQERIEVNLIGRCDVAEGARVIEMASDCDLVGCLKITGPLSRTETLDRMAQSNLLLLLAEGLTHQIPGKTYEYLRAGRPILALTAEGAVADLLRRTGGSWVVNADDKAGVTAAVREAYGHWRDGREGPRPDPGVVAGFDRRVLAGRFAEVFESSIAGVHR